MEWVSNHEKFEKLLRDCQREEMESFSPKLDELAVVNGMLANCESEATQYAQALVKAGGIVGKTIEAQIQEINMRHGMLSKRKQELEEELSSIRMSDDAIKQALQFQENIIEGMADPDYETKRRILELLKVEVKVQDGKCRVGFKPKIVSTNS